MGMELRGYQKEAIDAGLKYLKGRSKKPGVIVVPTGGGKSLCISKIAQGLDGPTLILQPSKEILVQNYEKAVGFGLKPTIYSASLNKKELSTLTYATIGSVKKEVKRLKEEVNLRYLLVDEAHMKYSPKEGSEFMNFISEFEGIKVLGFTATPCRLHSFSSMMDGNYSKLLMLTKGEPHYFENMVHVVQIQELVGMGYWSKIKYEVWEFDESDLELNGSGSEYTEESIKKCIQKNGVNNTIYLRIRMLLEERKHILVCMDSVENAYILSDFMNKKYGEITAVVEGGTPKKEREAIIERFKKGELKIVFNYATLSVGFDFPELDCVIFGRPTFSYAVYYQVVGRGVRVSPEKEDVLFIDCCNNYSRFGRVEDLTIEDYPDVGWGMFTGDKLISGVIMGAEITKQDIQRRIEERVRKKRDAEEGNFIMKFGKYKGWVVNKIPLGYLQWVIKNVPFSEDWDKYLAYVKKHELNAIKK